MNRIFLLAFSFVLSTLLSSNGALAVSALEKAQELVGVYTGHWALYNPDGSLNMAWDDRIEGSNARIEQGRALISVVNQVNVTFPAKYTYPLSFKEGFFINGPEGSAGEHFFEYESGDLLVEHEVSPTTWYIQSPAKISNYAKLGITQENAIMASCFTIKTVTYIGGLEVQRVTQTTTLVWRDNSGQTQTKQFVSLDGVHQRSNQQ